jgi:hypothetical protein
VAALLTAFPLSAQSHRHFCDDDQVPPEVLAAVQQQYPEWHFQLLTELSREYQQQWLKDHPEECPGFAVGHFQSATRTDFAMLLVRSRAAQSGSKLVVVSETPAKKWQVKALKEETTSYYYEAVSRVAPGKYKGKNPGSVALTLDGFQLDTFDVGSTLYYWRNGKFQTLPTK